MIPPYSLGTARTGAHATCSKSRLSPCTLAKNLPTDARFHPKEDVSGSTSLKSSVQRHIRQSLLDQLPLLSQPSYKAPTDSSAPTDAPALAPAEAVEPAAVKEEKEEGGKKKGGKGKGGKGKGGKKDKKDKEEEEEAGEGGKDEGESLVIDEIWPKKESLGLTKWYVTSSHLEYLARTNKGPIRCGHGLTSSHDRISIYTVNAVPLFFNHFDGPFIPTLKLLHKCT